MDMSEPYDINFCFPVRELESARVKLTPFIPSIHGEVYFTASCSYPELYTYLPFGPYATSEEFLTQVVENRIRRDPALMLFAVLNKPQLTAQEAEAATETETKSKTELAGIIGLLNTSPQNLSTEIGFVITLPPFQRTHVTTNAIGLLLHWCLDPPIRGGLGLRRVQWQANARNTSSVRAAERMGFKMEMVQRWQRVLPRGKPGNGMEVREGDPKKDWEGRHTALLSLCWDDWEEQRERVKALMDRR